MTNPIRVIDWLGIVGCALLLLNFLASFFVRAFTTRGRRLGGARLRLTWAAPWGTTAFYFLTQLYPFGVFTRVAVQVSSALVVVSLATAMLYTLTQPGGWRRIL